MVQASPLRHIFSSCDIFYRGVFVEPSFSLGGAPNVGGVPRNGRELHDMAAFLLSLTHVFYLVFV